jgi:hypothetical protein
MDGMHNMHSAFYHSTQLLGDSISRRPEKLLHHPIRLLGIAFLEDSTNYL